MFFDRPLSGIIWRGACLPVRNEPLSIIVKDFPPHSDRPLSETDLQAFADGLLTPGRAERVDAYLKQRPREAHRVAFYGRLNAQIRDAFPATDEPLPRGAGQPAGGRLSRAWRRLAARVSPGLVALVFAAAAAGGWMAAFDVSAMALNDAALMALMDPTAGRDRQHAPSPVEAAAAPNLASVGMRLVSVGSMKVGLVARASRYVYQSRNGAPVVLMSAPSLNLPPRPQWIAHRVGSYRLLMWTHVARRYVIAGDATTPGMMRAADAVTDAHNEP
ncbi:hypothetical protein SAMN05445871_4154 [Paraburkholderia caballeronis]|uniref:Transmembrane transcriptional regulator (Anti-sigma factor RsiW) n=1 Tax=Paraburkholderia caballeronis TaxID=416943 RepID=A0A1H7KS82_9BURK|nr:hypothetical protein C7403_10225 [Paraburkholderia caballeronis]PXX03500.1 hypothetical protein C7407_10225 [Paraburkholderia caballeronis]RAK04244.1 hypothetical protein C7409_10225 [Paraburkholderia caballeronis]SED87986.1 hypothetical protein SAMN05445871_4154 [Paraburkholderia caballeronis]SEK89414.1 hypothetical protein SAMN05192542_10425 [Paraburkholderia caballeronis]